jgi:hypothetical protein
LGLGDLHRDEGNLAAARTCYEESLAIAQEAGEMQTVGFALQWLGVLALPDDRNQARQILEQCQATF